jgi:hypothetical protein
VRVACLKPWPTRAEVARAECLDAAHFVLELQTTAAGEMGQATSGVGESGGEVNTYYDEFLQARQQPWHAADFGAAETAWRVDGLVTLLLRTVEGSTASVGISDLSLTAREANAFYTKGPKPPDVVLARVDKAARAQAKKAAKGGQPRRRSSTAVAQFQSSRGPG